MNLSEIQAALRSGGHEAWLFYDHHHRDPIAYRVLGLPTDRLTSRRWFYVIPAQGEPKKLVHRIESHHLDSLPGSKLEYSAWEELWSNLEAMIKPYSKLVMQYSPNNQIPYISLVDAGMLELIRSFGKEIVTSANLVAYFEATLTEKQIASHYKAQGKIDQITAGTFQEIGRRVRNGGTHEYEIQQWIMEAFRREDLVTCDPPNVSVNAHSGDPHYEPSSTSSAPIRQGDFVLLDIWAKTNEPDAVFYDITWTGVVGREPTEREQKVFETVRNARDAAIEAVEGAFAAGRPIRGFEADDAARAVICEAGFGEYFTHRTGHNIAQEIHGPGAHLDNLETHDERLLLPNTCFSVEPGIYLPEFGVRSEVDMLTGPGKAWVTGKIQRELVRI